MWALLISSVLVRVAVLTIWMVSGIALWFPAISLSFLIEFTHLSNCSIQSHISVLFVHVTVAFSWLILQNDSVSLNLIGVLLENLIYFSQPRSHSRFLHWFSWTCSGLPCVSFVTWIKPELCSCNNWIWGENSHGKSVWVWVLLWSHRSSSHDVLVNLFIKLIRSFARLDPLCAWSFDYL